MILPRTLSAGHAWLSKRVGRSKNRHRESGASRHVQDQEWPVGGDPRQGGRTAQRAAGRLHRPPDAKGNAAPPVSTLEIPTSVRRRWRSFGAARFDPIDSPIDRGINETLELFRGMPASLRCQANGRHRLV